MKKKLHRSDCCRIVVTGGPGGGKTTAADLFRREIGDRVVIVPEAATILFQGGFPRSPKPLAQRFAQTAIDGAAYWPGEPGDYFAAIGTTHEAELRRYDAVIFFESAAVGGSSIEGGNPVRNESIEEAVVLDAKLRRLWAPHPQFVLVSHNPSFFKKISFGLAALESMVARLTASPAKRKRTR